MALRRLSIHLFPSFESRLFDPLAAREDRRLATVVDIRRGDVLQRFVQPAVVVVRDEASEGAFEFWKLAVTGSILLMAMRPKAS